MGKQSDPLVQRRRYRAVFISPHLDDAVFSCGGVIAQMVKEGPVMVLNIFTRYLSEVKLRGVVLGNERYQEEADAARFLGYESCNLGELDVSFRREAYKKLGNIFRPPVQEDMEWLPPLREKVFGLLADIDYEQIYVPLGIGWHVDHVLTYLLFEPWAGRAGLLYYEDAPYCCIPHSARYRLNEIALYSRAPDLVPTNETRAWWQTTRAYARTALMKNLKPWTLRQLAIPVVGFYLHRLMALHRKQADGALGKRRLAAREFQIGDQFEQKVEAMALYSSQFGEFFTDREDCIATLNNYSEGHGSGAGPVERYWEDQ